MTTESPRVLILGAGSIGTRHAANLTAAGAQVDVMDLLPERAAAIPSVSARPLDLGSMDGYDGIVVATPTVLHSEHASAALGTGAKVLVEKPLASDPEAAIELARLGGDSLHVAYNLRFHAPVQQTISAISGSIGPVSSLRLWFGAWLPDWRPAIDYRSSYSAQRRLGGGVLLDAIHELDLVLWALPGAALEVVGSVVARLGPLEIDVEDTVHALLRTDDGMTAVQISLDYLARRYRRGMEATGATATVRLDWAREVIELEDGVGRQVQPAATPISTSYELQDAAFVSWLQGGAPLPVDGATGAASVALAAAIRSAAT